MSDQAPFWILLVFCLVLFVINELQYRTLRQSLAVIQELTEERDAALQTIELFVHGESDMPAQATPSSGGAG